MNWPVMVFDIESIPDVQGLRALGAYPAELSDAQVHAQWVQERKAQNKSDFLPLHLQRILCISVVFRNTEGLRIHSFVDRDNASEGKIIQQFFNSLDKHIPQLVSWNGGGFDLPVMHHRGMIKGVQAHKYWDMGEGGDHDSREFKWNNYISRYHLRHLDLMDLLALYQAKANAPLDAMAKLCGFPGKLGMDGAQVYESYLAGGIEDIRRYCETDVMNTYLLYCRFQKMRGGFSETDYAQEIKFVKETLADLSPTETHWEQYLQAWSA
jgi:3'-5' exonuclease